MAGTHLGLERGGFTLLLVVRLGVDIFDCRCSPFAPLHCLTLLEYISGGIYNFCSGLLCPCNLQVKTVRSRFDPTLELSDLSC